MRLLLVSGRVVFVEPVELASQRPCSRKPHESHARTVIGSCHDAVSTQCGVMFFVFVSFPGRFIQIITKLLFLTVKLQTSSSRTSFL